MLRCTDLITARYRNVARPGVIVSTIVQGQDAETVTFTATPGKGLGYDVAVQRDTADMALAQHALAVADA